VIEAAERAAVTLGKASLSESLSETVPDGLTDTREDAIDAPLEEITPVPKPPPRMTELVCASAEPANDTDIRTKQLWNKLVVLRRFARLDTAIPLDAGMGIHIAFTRLIGSG
jgi:hypothetical protein